MKIQRKKSDMFLKGRLKKFRRRITYSDRFVGGLASTASLIMLLYTKTLRIKWFIHPEFHKFSSKKFIFGFWHGRQFLLVPGFKDSHIALMTDISWAGAIQTQILKRFGYPIIRGSSKRKGVEALLSMKHMLDQGNPGAFALDGPRGPVYQAKPGILFLADKTNVPIFPLASSAERAWVLKSTWCHYLLPKPFSRCAIVIGKPLRGNHVDQEELNRQVLHCTSLADKKVHAEWLKQSFEETT